MTMQLKPILVVEDDPVDREMIELAFTRAAVEHPVVKPPLRIQIVERLLSVRHGHDRMLDVRPIERQFDHFAIDRIVLDD